MWPKSSQNSENRHKTRASLNDTPATVSVSVSASRIRVLFVVYFCCSCLWHVVFIATVPVRNWSWSWP